MTPGSVGPRVPGARATRPWLIVSDGLVIVPGLTLSLLLRTVIPPKVVPPSDDAVIRIRFGLKNRGRPRPVGRVVARPGDIDVAGGRVGLRHRLPDRVDVAERGDVGVNRHASGVGAGSMPSHSYTALSDTSGTGVAPEKSYVSSTSAPTLLSVVFWSVRT